MSTVYELKLQRRREYSRNRWKRLKEAKSKGTHTPKEWDDMVSFFENTCCICLCQKPITKDHIIPIFHGGSDAIENLQPLCFSCNSGKMDSCDYRWQLANYLGKRLPLNYRTPLALYGETFYGY